MSRRRIAETKNQQQSVVRRNNLEKPQKAITTETTTLVVDSPERSKKRKLDEGKSHIVNEKEQIESSSKSPKRTKRVLANKQESNSAFNGSDLVNSKTPSPKKNKRQHKVEEDKLAFNELEATPSAHQAPDKLRGGCSIKEGNATTNVAKEEGIDDETSVKPKRHRKTKEEKEAEAMPLAARTKDLQMFVGAHTSIAKGVENAIHNCVHIGGNAFACFLKSQRKWENPPLKNENRDAFHKALIEHQYDASSHVVPHGSYLVNLATEDKDKAKQSYDAFVDDLHRCEALGIKYYNFHPGAAGQAPMAEAIQRLADRLNKALSETSTVVPLLENMATRGTIIGGKFSDLRDVIASIKPEYKSRIGVCIDTCHAFASGYDLRSPEAFKETLQEFDQVVGIKYLKALHMNDSKAPFASNRDLHQNIGLGFLGLRAFHNVMNEERFHNLPMILETPCDKPDPTDPKGIKTIEDKNTWAREIKLLESLIGMDPEGEEFKALEKKLSDEGREERDKMQVKFDEKVAKLEKKLEKGQKNLKDMFSKKKKTKDIESEAEDELH